MNALTSQLKTKLAELNISWGIPSVYDISYFLSLYAYGLTYMTLLSSTSQHSQRGLASLEYCGRLWPQLPLSRSTVQSAAGMGLDG